ncbi:MAG: 1-acyl-sn-glycerol-3-phosphate acyltransferase [Clostridia bacterium]|nr:1-acyl-sn-glycerol-3-phosphate acyltransferase [Clostridia bacterium]
MFYRVAKCICYLFLRFFCRWEVEGREHLPPSGPVIVFANHVSYLDPVVVGVALSRPVYFMAKEELFKIPVLKWIITGLHAFPVRRGQSDRSALKAAMQILNEGRVLGIFPEGKRSKDGRLNPFLGGAAFLAIKTGAPLLPVAIINSNKVLQGKRLKVQIGPPLYFERDGRSVSQQSHVITTAAYQTLAKMLA